MNKTNSGRGPKSESCQTVSDIATRISPSAPAIISALAKSLSRRFNDVLNFAVGEPDRHIPYAAELGLKYALKMGMTKYSPVAGLDELRRCVNAAEPERVVVFGGSKAAIFNTMLALINPGDEVILPAPYWTSYKYMIEAVKGVPVIVETKAENGFKLTAEALKGAIGDKTRMLIFNNPNNPTGVVYSGEEMEALGQVCLDNNIWILADEVYRLLCFNREFTSMKMLFPEITITVDGMSKGYSMTGLRIGWVEAPSEEVATAIARIASHCAGQANTPGQVAAINALNNGNGYVSVVKRHYRENRDLLVGLFADWGRLSFVMPEGGFYLLFNCGGDDIDFCKHLLADKRVALTPGSEFGKPGWVRWCFACSKKDLTDGFERLKEFVGPNEG